jgi:crotonobetainyl-CoA:carnitine CoA-transferase CaiB-like acyl-CoA transferase
MHETLLSGCRALDLTDEKGFVCGKILGALGVDVIKVERPGGDPSHNLPPFYQDIPDPEKSLYWKAFNTDKRDITLNIETEEGQKLFKRLVEKADFVIESFAPGYLDRLGLGYEALRLVNPRLIMASITPFGQNGPHSRYKGSELVATAMGGVANNTGDPDRAPVKESLDSTYFHAGAMAALGTMISYYHCELTGEGQQVDVSVQEVTAFRITGVVNAWQFDRMMLNRQGPRQLLGRVATRWVWACKDGYLFWHMLGGMQGAPANKALSDWIDETETDNPMREITDWPAFDKARMPPEQWDRMEEKITSFFMKFTKKEIAQETLKRGANAVTVADSGDVLASEQLAERGYWALIEDPALDRISKYPKYFFLCNETENFCRRPAPAIGADNDDVYVGELGLSSSEVSSLKSRNVI